MCFHLTSTIYFLMTKNIKEYPFMLFQACLNPWDEEIKSHLYDLLPIGITKSSTNKSSLCYKSF